MNRKRILIMTVMLIVIAAMTSFWSGESLSRYSADVATSAIFTKFGLNVDSNHREILL